MKGLFKYLTPLLSLLLVAACGSDKKDDPTPPPAPTLSSVAITDFKDVMQKGTSHPHKLTATYSDNSTKDVTADADWSSKNESVATVSDTGLVSAIEAGLTEIAAAYKGLTAESKSLSVKAETLTAVNILSDDVDIDVDGTKQLEVASVFSDGSSVKLTKDVTWKSASPEILTVNDTGVLTGVKPGETTVTATYQNIESNPIKVLVSELAPNGLWIKNQISTIEIGQDHDFIPQETFRNQDRKDVDPSSVTWNSNAPAIASFEGNTLTGKATGQVIITATRGTLTTPDLTVTVVAAGNELDSIAISTQSDTTEVAIGTYITFAAEGTYDNQSKIDITDAVQWKTSNPNVIEIGDNGGETQTVGAGSTNITAMLNGVESDPIEVTVVADNFDRIEVSHNGGEDNFPINGETQMEALGFTEGGASVDITNRVTWTSTDPEIATVSTEGSVEFIAEGTVTIGATIGEHSGSVTFTVTPEQ
ncbi:Ig-like domain-containing protein [Parashewanella tropica]|uniref:Ig-like domain-containing protein n=1 Tax=Parashewanella tropica TaxID=2547970 RepID=UPI00105A384E|nr:Ig-like domain-containing protein [Parashewanella tropica]